MDDFKVLFLQLRDYLKLQKENAAMGAAESLTVLLSAAVIGFVIINFVIAVLLLLGFSLAYWLGGLLGCDALGFVVVAGIMVVMGMVFWLKRRDWITNPIARLMVMVFMSDGNKEDGV